jgi:diguanylate cyclase (GGDEF)-like protein
MLVTAVYFAAILAAGMAAQWRARDLLLFGALLACVAGTVEMTRRAGENSGVIKDVYGVWLLPVAMLLPPVCALLSPLFQGILTQWRIRRNPVYRRVFSAAAIGLSYGSASIAFHWVIGPHTPTAGDLDKNAAVLIGAVAACGALQWVLNNSLVLVAVKGAEPTAKIRDMLLSREPLQNDTAELCVSVLVTISVAISPLTVAFAFPFVTLLQRSFRHAQLVNDSRIDAKTGLINAGTWEREADAEVIRAQRTHSPLAVALIDIDNFKQVNDQHGHLAGDRALSAVASTIKIFLRDYDLVGRFGGEEFAVLLPQTTGQDARRIAERMRAQVAEVPIDVGDISRTETIKLTVSVGLTMLGEKPSQVTDLLAAADVALYHAKHAGKNQVWMSSDIPAAAPAARPSPPKDLFPESAAEPGSY